MCQGKHGWKSPKNKWLPQQAGLVQVKRNHSLLPFVLPGPPLFSGSLVTAEDASQEKPAFISNWITSRVLKTPLKGSSLGKVSSKVSGGAVERSLRMRRRGSYDGTTAPIQPVSTSKGGDTKVFAYFLKLQIKILIILFYGSINKCI